MRADCYVSTTARRAVCLSTASEHLSTSMSGSLVLLEPVGWLTGWVLSEA